MVNEMIEATKQWSESHNRVREHHSRAIDALGQLVAEGREFASRLATIEREVYQLTDSYNTLRTKYEAKAFADGVPIIGDIEEALRAEVATLHSNALDEKTRIDIKANQHRHHCDSWWGRCRAVAQLFAPPDPAPHNDWGRNPRMAQVQTYGGQLWTSIDSIGPEDVVQGNLGDCWFAATIASLTLSASGRKMIHDMITDNGDGTFTVRFPSGVAVTVDGDVYVDGNGSPLAGRGQKGGDYWYSILEKAYVTATNRIGKPANSYQSLEGGRVEGDPWGDLYRTLGLYDRTLKGRVAELSVDEVTRVLKGANAGAPTTAEFPINVVSWNRVGGTHLVTVKRFEDGPPPLVIMRNPWGKNDLSQEVGGWGFGITQIPGSGGDFAMPLDQFMRYSTILTTSSWPK